MRRGKSFEWWKRSAMVGLLVGLVAGTSPAQAACINWPSECGQESIDPEPTDPRPLPMLIPDGVPPFVAALVAVRNVPLFDQPAECNFATKGDVKYLDEDHDEWKGKISKSVYTRHVWVCYGEDASNAWVFWRFQKANSGGWHLHHGGVNGPDCNTGSTIAYCIQVTNLGVGQFTARTPGDQGGNGCEAVSFSLEGGGFGAGWGGNVCATRWFVQDHSLQGARWAVTKSAWTGVHESIVFDFGVLHKVPKAGDGTWESKLEVSMLTGFHQSWSGPSEESWTLSATSSGLADPNT